MKKYLFVLFSFLSLLSFILLSKYEDRDILRNVDFAVTVKVQESIDTSSHLRFASFVGNLMEGATFFASPEFTVVVTLIMTGIAVYDRKKKRWNIWALCIPLFLVLIVGAEIYGKSIVHHPPPPFSMIKNPTTLFPANYVSEHFSYPSGHAARAVFLAIVSYYVLRITYVANRKKLLLSVLGLLGYVLLVGVSRIYLGHHWFSDVMGGILLGLATGPSVWYLINYVSTSKKTTGKNQ